MLVPSECSMSKQCGCFPTMTVNCFKIFIRVFKAIVFRFVYLWQKVISNDTPRSVNKVKYSGMFIIYSFKKIAFKAELAPLLGVTGFEPVTNKLKAYCSTNWATHPFFTDRGTWTPTKRSLEPKSSMSTNSIISALSKFWA